VGENGVQMDVLLTPTHLLSPSNKMEDHRMTISVEVEEVETVMEIVEGTEVVTDEVVVTEAAVANKDEMIEVEEDVREVEEEGTTTEVVAAEEAVVVAVGTIRFQTRNLSLHM